MEIYDISMPLQAGMAKYPSLRDFEHRFEKTFLGGDGVNLSCIRMQNHLGTHVDAPLHYIEDGRDISLMAAEIFVGDAYVVESPTNEIHASLISMAPPHYTRLLFKTPHSRSKEDNCGKEIFSFFGDEAARALVQRHPHLVGIDSFSVDCLGRKDKFVHKTLLGEGIALLEGINLSDVSAGAFWISCPPLKVVGAEGAPCRAILIRKEL
jgi:arylformamidase